MAWLARNLVFALACAVAGFVVVALAGAAGLRADDQDAIEVGEYVFTLMLSAILGLAAPTGAPGEPITLIYAVNATPFGYVTDQDSVDPGSSARVGLLARDGVAQFDSFALYLAD